MASTAFTELLSYHEMLAAPRRHSPNEWALLSIAERYARRALKAVPTTQVEALLPDARERYTQLRDELRKTPGTATEWDKRVAQVRGAVSVLQPMMEQV